MVSSENKVENHFFKKSNSKNWQTYSNKRRDQKEISILNCNSLSNENNTVSNNCKKLCLFYSGNIMYHQTKFKARLRKSNMFNNDKFKFMHSILINICHLYAKNHYQPMNLRLNGTSDIQFLDIPIDINLSLSNWLYNRYNISINSGLYQSIYHLILDNNLEDIDASLYDKLPNYLMHLFA